MNPHFTAYSKEALWSCWLSCSNIPSGPSFKDKDHHPALQSNVTVPEISMSFKRRISYDTLISRALITSAQILSTPGTLPLWRPMQWPLPKRWARTLLRILRRKCYCWVLDLIIVFLPPTIFSFIYTCGEQHLSKNRLSESLEGCLKVDLWLIPSAPAICQMCGDGKAARVRTSLFSSLKCSLCMNKWVQHLSGSQVVIFDWLPNFKSRVLSMRLSVGKHNYLLRPMKYFVKFSFCVCLFVNLNDWNQCHNKRTGAGWLKDAMSGAMVGS